MTSTYAQLLHECTTAGDWAAALRLARLVDQPSLWAALAALAWPGTTVAASSGPLPSPSLAQIQLRLTATTEALARLHLVDKMAAVRARLQRASPRAAAGGEAAAAAAEGTFHA